MTYIFKYDVETAYMDSTFIMTKVPGGLKVVCKNKSGQVIEYGHKFYASGVTTTFLDHTSGKSGFIEFDRFVDFSGVFKPVTYVGTSEVAVAFGCPLEAVQKAMNDPAAKLEIKESGCHFVASFKAKGLEELEDVVFKLDEEFDWKNPFDPTDNMKMIATAKDNMMICAAKGKMSLKVNYTFTDNFLLKETEIVGTDLKEKVIFVRCC